jgi:predicted esterase
MKNFTYLCRAFILFALFSAGTFTAFSQQIETSLTSSTGQRLGFLQFTPKGYATEGNVKHPLIIFLHGVGEKGNGTTELKNVANYGLPKMLKDGWDTKTTWNGKTETFIVLSPQCPSAEWMWPQAFVDDLLKYAKENLRVDPDRIYLSGLSMGAGGSNRYLSTVANGASNFAAAGLICTPNLFTEAKYVVAAKLPYWAFHATDDNIVSWKFSESAVNKIIAAGNEVKPKLTIWPTGGHMVWDRVYMDTNYKWDNAINIYEWFLGQNRTFAPNKLPVAQAGADQRVRPSLAALTLNAGASTDADGKIVRYVWKKLSGPLGGTIAKIMSASSSTTVSGMSTAGVYQFELSVVDDRAGVSKDTVTITVAADAPLPTAPKPVDTIVIVKPVDTVKPVPAKPVDTVKTTPAKPVDAPLPTAPKPVDTVKPVTPVPASGNKAPVARVQKADIVVPMEWNWFPELNASPSTDADGWIGLFTWEKISGPEAYKIVSPKTCATKLDKLVPGVYVFRVTAHDNKGAISTADVKVTITKKELAPVTTIASKSIVEEEPVAAVPVTVLSMPAQVVLSPNPAVSMINLQYTSSQEGRSFINVHDASGRLVKSIVFNKTAGLYKHNLDISQLISGVYYVQVQTGNAVQINTKFVKR